MKMSGRLVPTCHASPSNKNCRCGNAHDGPGRKKERRQAKRGKNNVKASLRKFWPQEIEDTSTHPAWDFELPDYGDE